MEPPRTISVSQVNAYLGCPLKYRFQYVDKIPRPWRVAPMAFGSSVHAAVEWFHKERLAGGSPELASVLQVFDADWYAHNTEPLVFSERESRLRGVDSDRDLGAASDSPKSDSRLWQPRSLATPNPPRQFDPTREHGSSQSAALLMNHSTGESLQPQNTGSPTPGPAAVDGGGELIFPEQMLPDERQAARVLLRPCGDRAQALLDELAGRLQMGGVRSSPVAYLRGLIARADAGSFVPELGPRVAAARERRQQDAGQRREREAEERRIAAERATPEDQARARVQREKVGQMLDELKVRMNTGRPT